MSRPPEGMTSAPPGPRGEPRDAIDDDPGVLVRSVAYDGPIAQA